MKWHLHFPRRLSWAVVCAALLGVTASAASCPGAVFVSYDISASPDGSTASIPAGGLDAAIASASSLTRGTGLSTAGGYNPVGGWFVGNPGTSDLYSVNNPTLATAITAKAYMTFTITAKADQSLSITQFASKIQANGTPLPQIALLSNVTGFSAANALATRELPGSGETWNVDLSGVTALQNIPAGSSVEFRVYFWNFQNTVNRYAGFRSSPVTISGTAATVTIPEPASFGLLCTAGLLVAASRRRF